MVDEKKTFPMLPVGAWWELRKKFKQSIPGIVTDNYLATVLEMKIDSARNNVLGPLKQLGIIDEEGRTQDRARQWRDDAVYPQVCKEILKEVYPSDLLDAVPNPVTAARPSRELVRKPYRPWRERRQKDGGDVHCACRSRPCQSAGKG